MNIRSLLGRVKRKLQRRKYLGDIDSITKIRARNEDFNRVRDLIRQSGTDSLSHFGNGYTHEGGLSLQQNPDEFAGLICLLKEYAGKDGPYENYMEIGSASGGSCLLLSQELNFQSILSLDDGTHPRAIEQKVNFQKIANLNQFVGDSHSRAAQEFLSSNVKGQIDIAFIDGDHSYEGVRDDLKLSLQYCKPGALVIFHDTVACEGVEKVWLDSVASKQLSPLAEYIGAERGLGIAVAKVV